MNNLKVIDIIITGDLCPQHRIESLSISGDAHQIYDDKILEVLKNKDLSITNLECPLTTTNSPIQKVGPNLRADPKAIASLKVAEFNIATLANNHIMDQGTIGLEDTVKACNEADIMTVGVGKNLNEAKQPLYFYVNDSCIGIINVAEHEFCIATSQSAGANPFDLPLIYNQILIAKTKADFVLVIVHGGNEHYHLPSLELKKTYRFLADIGANAVISHHTHFASGFEVYNNIPIFYSLGNFIFDNAVKRPDYWYKGYFIKLSFCKEKPPTFTLYPYTQCEDQAIIELMEGDKKEAYLSEIEAFNEIIQDNERLEQSWDEFTESTKIMYYSNLFQLNKVERFLLKKRMSGFLHNKEDKYLPKLLNLFRCQSHRNAIIKVLTKNANTI